MFSFAHLRTAATRTSALRRPWLLNQSPKRRPCLDVVGRKSSSSSSTPPPTTTTPPPNPLQERAKQMHNEIESIMNKHDARVDQEAKKVKKWAGFVDFLRTNRTNISVIVVSFLTVILSVKLVQGKSRQRELEQELKDTDEKLEEKRLLLKTITTQSFQSTLADHCAAKILGQDYSKDAPSSSWGWSSKNSPSTTISSNQDIKAALYTVLANDLNSLVGDAALSEDEKNAKDLEELQDDTKLKALSESSESQKVQDDPATTKEEWVEDANGKKIVKKSVFVI